MNTHTTHITVIVPSKSLYTQSVSIYMKGRGCSFFQLGASKQSHRAFDNGENQSQSNKKGSAHPFQKLHMGQFFCI